MSAELRTSLQMSTADEQRWSRAVLAVTPDADLGEDPQRRDERIARIVLSGLVEPGDRIAGALVGRAGSAVSVITALVEPEHASRRAELLLAMREAGISDTELADAFLRWKARLNPAESLRQVERLAALKGSLVIPGDDSWPRALDDLGEHAPHALWLRGRIEMLRRLTESLAVVGARASTGYGEHVVMEYVGALAESGICIISGAAYGIDGMAHRTALAVGGPTIAVLAGGVDRFYPSGHDALLHRIVESGLVISEMPCGFAPTKWRFLQRNRLIAALSTATLVVEAGRRSGSLNTAHHALALGRPLGAIPGPITSGSSVGCHRLLRETEAVCVTSAEEMKALLPQYSDPDTYTPYIDMTEEETRVRDALSNRSWRDLDRIMREAGVNSTQAMAALGGLELQGIARTDGVGWRLVRAG